jgi:hypothetical protein
VTDKLIHMYKTLEGETVPELKTAEHPLKTAGGLASGRIHAVTEDGTILVVIPSGSQPPFRAGTLLDVGPSDVGLEVVLAFTPERGDRPVILGMVEERSRRESKARIDMERSDVQDLRIDGQSVHFKAADEVLLECGQGSIRIRRDGKIIIKGLQIVSRAKGVNKIKGAAVSIN